MASRRCARRTHLLFLMPAAVDRASAKSYWFTGEKRAEIFPEFARAPNRYTPIRRSPLYSSRLIAKLSGESTSPEPVPPSIVYVSWYPEREPVVLKDRKRQASNFHAHATANLQGQRRGSCRQATGASPPSYRRPNFLLCWEAELSIFP